MLRAIALVLVVTFVVPATAEARDITLSGPGKTTYGHQVTFTGRLTPPEHRVEVGIYLGSSVVATVLTNENGFFVARPNLFSDGGYRARAPGAVSPPHRVEVVDAGGGDPGGDPEPGRELAIDGPGATTRGHQVTFTGRLDPPRARVEVGVYLGSSRVASALTNKKGFWVARPNLFATGYYRARAPGAVSDRHHVEIVGGAPGDVPTLREAIEQMDALGYAVRTTDVSSMTGAVRQTIYAFQKAQGLVVDGKLGPDTHAALRDPDPVRPRYTSPADHIEVDKDRQLLLLVRDGEVERIVNASTAGIEGYYTPEGRFEVFRRVEGIDESPLGKLWNPLYFYRGWAIHGSTSVPPRPASHGCVRIALWQAERFFESIPHGETVIVY